jgi:hypothetical protein
MKQSFFYKKDSFASLLFTFLTYFELSISLIVPLISISNIPVIRLMSKNAKIAQPKEL